MDEQREQELAHHITKLWEIAERLVAANELERGYAIFEVIQLLESMQSVSPDS